MKKKSCIGGIEVLLATYVWLGRENEKKARLEKLLVRQQKKTA